MVCFYAEDLPVCFRLTIVLYDGIYWDLYIGIIGTWLYGHVFFAHVHLKEACQQKLTGARRASRGEGHSPTRLYIRSGSKTMVSDASGSHGLFALWGGNLSATLKTEK